MIGLVPNSTLLVQETPICQDIQRYSSCINDSKAKCFLFLFVCFCFCLFLFFCGGGVFFSPSFLQLV